MYPRFDKMKELTDIKQAYFINHLNETVLNKDVACILDVVQVEQCILWTSAEPSRAIALLDHYKLTNKFKKIIYSEKINIIHDIQSICVHGYCEQEDLVFYEDNTDIIKSLKKLKFSVCEIV